MAKFVDAWTFDWDKYSPDDLVQKCDSFQPGPALLAPLVKAAVLPLAVLALGCVGRDQDQSDPPARNGGQQECQRCTPPNVRFGSKADMCSAKGDVRFVPKADIALPIRFLPIRRKARCRSPRVD